MKDTTCKCMKCGREQRVTFAACLIAGWPVCCGLTMHVTKPPKELEDIAEAAIRAQLPR